MTRIARFDRIHRMNRLALASAFTVLMVAWPGQGVTATVHFNPDAGTFEWRSSDSWSSAELPTAADDVVIGDPISGHEAWVQLYQPLGRYSTEVASLTIHPGGEVSLVRSDLLVGGTVQQGGVLRLSGGSTLQALGSITLKTNGLTELLGTGPRNVLSAGGPGMVIEGGHRLQGAGLINSSIIQNQGQVLAKGGVLQVGHVDNFGGQLGSTDNGVLISTGVVRGGVISGVVNGTFANNTFGDSRGRFTLADSITNDGVMQLSAITGAQGTQQEAALIGQAGLFVKGKGSIVANSVTPALLQDVGIGAEQRFLGHARVAGALVNHGVMDIQGGTLHTADTTPTTWRNSGQIGVQHGAGIQAGDIDNSGGQITLAGTGYISAGQVTGGDIRGQSGGRIQEAHLRETSLSGELSSQSIQLSGLVALEGTLTNLGKLIVNEAAHLLSTVGQIRNQGLIQVLTGGKLSVGGGIQNQGQRIELADGSRIGESRIEGGTLARTNQASGQVILDGPVTLRDVQFEGSHRLVTSRPLTLSGAITVLDLLDIDNIDPDSRWVQNLQLDGEVSLRGPGTTRVSFPLFESASITQGGRLVIESDHTLETQGDMLIGNIVNKGLLKLTRQNEPWDRLVVGVVNEGQLDVASGESVMLYEFVNRGGTVRLGEGTRMQVANSLVGGVIEGSNAPGGSHLGGALLQDVTLAGQISLMGVTQEAPKPPATTQATGSLTVNGTLRVGSGEKGLALAGDTRLQGSGQTIIKGMPSPVISKADGAAATPTLTIAAGHTLRGSGAIVGVKVVNQGHMRVEDGHLGLNSSEALINEGTLTIGRPGMSSNTALIQRGEDAVMNIDGALVTPQLLIQGGLLHTYNLLLNGDLIVERGHMTALAKATEVGGNVTFGDDAVIELNLDDEDFLDAWMVYGSLRLGGDLIINMITAEPNIASESGIYFLFSTSQQIQGSFKSLTVRGSSLNWELLNLGSELALVVAPAVPEPETWALLLGGLGALAWRRRRHAH